PTALITWQSNTEVSSIVTYYPQETPSQARDEVNVELTKGAHRMIVRGLKPQTPYILVVKGRDKIGNEAVSDSQKFTTATDTRPPLITDLRVEGTAIPQTAGTAQESVGQIVVTWNTDEPATGQVEFGEGTGSNYSQRTQEDSNLTYNHVVVISNLATSKVYHLRAISKDSAENEGHSVDTVTITPKATDNALNLVISGLQQAFGFLGGLKQ
ncbi:MAG: fibronectin type III domain-containing protein, partial [Candidatus Beckwithbacteria bacterium]